MNDTPRYANLRDGGNLPSKPRPGSIRYAIALVVLPALLWNLPEIMRAIGRLM